MKKIAIILGMILLAAGTAFAAEKLLFSDNFKNYKTGADASPAWDIMNGNWEVTEEGFEGKNSGTGGFSAVGAAAGDEAWQNYILKLKFKVLEVGGDWRDGPWIGFRFLDQGTNYTLGFYASGAYLHKANEGASTGDNNPLAQYGCAVMDGKWHSLEIKAESNRIAIKIDGKGVIDILDDNLADIPAPKAGRIMLSARRFNPGTTAVVFSNVEVFGIVHTADEQTLRAKTEEKLKIQKALWEALTKKAGGIASVAGEASEDPVFIYLANWLKRIEASFKEAEQKVKVFEVETAGKTADEIEADLKTIGQRMAVFK